MYIRTIGGKAARVSAIVSNKYLNAAYNWMPPEIMKGDLTTEKSDIYSFCTVMWEMFTGMSNCLLIFYHSCLDEFNALFPL